MSTPFSSRPNFGQNQIAPRVFREGDTDTSPGQASLRAPPRVAVEGIVGALQGHGNAMIAIQIKKSRGNCVLTVPLPLQAFEPSG